jgi:hypothetical protein
MHRPPGVESGPLPHHHTAVSPHRSHLPGQLDHAPSATDHANGPRYDGHHLLAEPRIITLRRGRQVNRHASLRR